MKITILQRGGMTGHHAALLAQVQALQKQVKPVDRDAEFIRKRSELAGHLSIYNE